MSVTCLYRRLFVALLIVQPCPPHDELFAQRAVEGDSSWNPMDSPDLDPLRPNACLARRDSTHICSSVICPSRPVSEKAVSSMASASISRDLKNPSLLERLNVGASGSAVRE